MPKRRAATDVAVIGGGPAAWSAAAALAEAGLAVALVGPSPERAWAPTYALWLDDAPAGLPDGALAHRWPSVEVRVAHPVTVPRAYGVLDNAATLAWLAGRARTAGTAVVDAMVAGVDARTRGEVADVLLADGRVVTARLVVDASGHDPVAVRPPLRSVPAWQVAHGVVVDPEVARGLGVDPSRCVLMDWRDAGTDRRTPTFLYALAVHDGVLLEETQLAGRPPLDDETLRTRLVARLGHPGALGGADGGVRIERVRIPMGSAVPARSQPVVGFGAAAAMIHPATGYSVGAALRTAPRLAAAVADGIRVRRATSRSLAEVAWRAVWPATALRARHLHQYGLAALLRLDAPATRSFFAAFFSLPDEVWFPHLTGTADAAHVRLVMREVFARVPWSVRRSLASGGPWPLLRSMAP